MAPTNLLIVYLLGLVFSPTYGSPKIRTFLSCSLLFGNEADWMKHLLDSRFSEEEEYCLQRGKVFYKPNGNCYKLLSRGPCKDSEWLVYNSELAENYGRLKAVCQRRPCSNGYIYMAADHKCHRSEHVINKVCPEELDLTYKYNGFGEAYCVCTDEKLHLATDSEDRVCYNVFERGPCRHGYIFVPSSDVFDIGIAKCIPDPCFHEDKGEKSIVLQVKTSDGYRSCYELGSHGPCYSGNATCSIQSLEVLPSKVVPHCEANRRHGIGRPAIVGENCALNKKGECVKVLTSKDPVRPEDAYDY